MSFAELKSEAMRLNPTQRARLVRSLIKTFKADDELVLSWEELESRAGDLSSGRVKGIPAHEVHAAARRRYGLA